MTSGLLFSWRTLRHASALRPRIVFAAAAAKVEPHLRLGKVDTEAEQALSARFTIRSIPSLVLVEEGQPIARTAIAQEFLSSLLGLPEVKGLLSGEHFSVDGTLLKAWASMKSFRPKSASGEGAGNGPGEPPPPGRNREADFRKTKRSNKTHASTTDKDARLYRKGAGQESRLCYLGHALMENRNGLVAAAEATLATGTAEREAAAAFSQRLPKGPTLGADKGYDAEAFVEGLKARGIEPHIAINGTVSKHGKARKTAVPSEVAASVPPGL